MIMNKLKRTFYHNNYIDVKPCSFKVSRFCQIQELCTVTCIFVLHLVATTAERDNLCFDEFYGSPTQHRSYSTEHTFECVNYVENSIHIKHTSV